MTTIPTQMMTGSSTALVWRRTQRTMKVRVLFGDVVAACSVKAVSEL
jgi:hypothetical protein